MKNLIFTLIFIVTNSLLSVAQETTMTTMQDKMMLKDSTENCCTNCYSNLVAIGGKYYFNTLGNTRTTLASNGFLMDQEAFEYQFRLYNLPKIFYFQQLGTLTNENYASVTGFGIKEDLRLPIFKNSNFILTPYIEVGGGYYRMNIAKGITSNTISTVLNSKVENYFLDNFVVSGDVGLDLGFNFTFDNKRLNVIFNGGYIANYPTEWRMAGSLAFREKINLASPYAGVTVRLEMDCSNKCCGGGQNKCK
ncbi:MAG: hypothetical protein IPN86_03825 [Saprospiraceae bacterium]|nr:hypothetical protein [Saprospiraceae bacterium]